VPQEDEATCFFLVAVLTLGSPRLAALLNMVSMASKRPSNGRSATLWGEWDGERKTWFRFCIRRFGGQMARQQAAAVVASVPMHGGKVLANTSRLTIKQQWHAA